MGGILILQLCCPSCDLFYFGLVEWLPPDVYSPRTAMNDPSSDGVEVVKPKRCRKNMKQSQGTSPKVRMDRLRAKIEELNHRNEVLQVNYNKQTEMMAKEVAVRDTLINLLKVSETTSTNRLTLIQKEVPNFPRAVLGGKFDSYRANL